jgi:hypothetical protein
MPLSTAAHSARQPAAVAIDEAVLRPAVQAF